jgi:GH15 family glucan-1,4-alpha-glucosidase
MASDPYLVFGKDALLDLGLLPEEIDSESGEARGNTPLALSHSGLACTAALLDRAGALA